MGGMALVALAEEHLDGGCSYRMLVAAVFAAGLIVALRAHIIRTQSSPNPLQLPLHAGRTTHAASSQCVCPQLPSFSRHRAEARRAPAAPAFARRLATPQPGVPAAKFFGAHATALRVPHRSNAFRTPVSRAPRLSAGSSTSPLRPAPRQSPEWGNTTNMSRGKAWSDRTTLGTLSIPRLGIGTISWKESDSKQLFEATDLARRSGLTFFDTAERYGASVATTLGLGWGECETLLAKAKKRSDMSSEGNSDLVIATKFTPSPWRSDAESVVKACRESAKRLGCLDTGIDLYQIHMPDIVKPFRFLGFDDKNDEAFWDGIATCYQQGLAKNVGVSNYGPTLLRRAHAALAQRGVPLASNQINYSLLHRHNGAQETLDAALDLGVTTLAYFPLCMGLLADKYNCESEGDGVAVRAGSEAKTFGVDKRMIRPAAEIKDLLEAHGEATELLRCLRHMSTKYNRSPSQIALNYVICKGGVPIVGARTVDHIDSNAGSLGWRLSRADIIALEDAADATGLIFQGAGFKRSSEKFVGYGVEKWSLD